MPSMPVLDGINGLVSALDEPADGYCVFHDTPHERRRSIRHSEVILSRDRVCRSQYAVRGWSMP
jgi:hypothetical protein